LETTDLKDFQKRLADKVGQVLVKHREEVTDFLDPFLVPFTDLMALTSNSLPRQIAHASTIFNILNSLVVLPFANLFANFIIWLVPDKDYY
jgi:Na+/phosphate symporter